MNTFERVSYVDEIERATERFRQMSFTECIEFWNNSACDHYCRYWEIHEMSDLDWWNILANEFGTWQIVHSVLSSGERFNDSDKWFFFDQDNEQLVSFSTKQEMTEIIGDDFFIENLMNE